MYCYHCVKEIGEADTFCMHCGTRIKALQTPQPPLTISPAPAPVQQAPVQQNTDQMQPLAIVGFSLSFLTLAAGIISFFFISLLTVAFISGIVGLVLSIVGLVRCRKTGKTGKGFAISGIVLNAVFVGIATILLLVYIFAFFFAISFLWAAI